MIHLPRSPEQPMVNFHPDVRFLTDYAAASLPHAQALCVSSHLHYCPSCRGKVRELTELGAELFVQQPPAALAPRAFERLLGRIEDSPRTPPPASPVRRKSDLPTALDKLTRGNVENLRWRRIGKNVRYSNVELGDPQRETTLLHIKAGGSIPHHRHRGDELTVILKGSFSDNEGHYSVGDFVVRTPGEAHKPVASQDEDCLCLITLDAPVVMSNWLYRLLLPLANRFAPDAT